MTIKPLGWLKTSEGWLAETVFIDYTVTTHGDDVFWHDGAKFHESPSIEQAKIEAENDWYEKLKTVLKR